MKKNDIDVKITTALLDLMEEKEYDDISIKDIVSKAGLSRVTYYRHFNSKEDILIRYLELAKKRFMDQTRLSSESNPENAEIAIYALFLFFKANMKINKCLRKARLDNELLKFLSNDFLLNLPVKLDKYVAYFVAGALYNVLINWLDEYCKDSIEEVSKPFVNVQNLFKENK